MRRTLLLIHLLVASVIAPAFLMLAVSGGLYLVGIKGEVTSEQIDIPIETSSKYVDIDGESAVKALFAEIGLKHNFEYLKSRGDFIQTRPTSKVHIEIRRKSEGIELWRQRPNFQKRLIELHKGHGPRVFKTYQKFVAVALILAIFSGLWMGLANPTLRRKTLISSALGLLVFITLATAP